jgi:hypothetical protein
MTTIASRNIENRDEWPNPETWAVCRAARLDPDTAQGRESATAMRDDPEMSKDRRQLSGALARELREEFELFYCSYSGLAHDLLELAGAKVDWDEVAEELLSSFFFGLLKPHPE